MREFAIAAGIALIFILGIWKCAKIARRPTTNTLAALGLAAILGGWMIAVVGGTLRSFDNVIVTALAALGGVLAFGLWVTGTVLAVIGLVQIYRDRSRYTQGLCQAWSTIAIVALFVYAVLGLQEYRTATPTTVETQTFHAQNFRFEPPPAGWGPIRSDLVNEDATLALIRGRSSMWFILIAEALGNDNVWETEDLAEFAEATLRSTGTDHRRIDRSEHVVNGLPGMLTVSSVRMLGTDITYVQWVCSVNGYQYQLAAWGPSRKGHGTIRSQAEELFRSFHLIDSARIADGGASLGDYASDRYGYTATFAGSGFHEWEGLEQDVPPADLGGWSGTDAAFVVSAVALMGHRPDPEDFGYAIIEALGVVDVSLCRPAAGVSWPRGFAGVAFRCNTTIDGDAFEYDIRAFRGENYGYAIHAWTVVGDAEPEGFGDDVFARIAADSEHPRLGDTDVLSERERRRHSTFFAALGSRHFDDNQPTVAARYFETANRLEPDDPDILIQLLQARSWSGEHRAAHELLMRYEGRFEGNQALWSYEPFLLAQLGRDDEAVDRFQALFADGYVNDEDFSFYLDLLERLGRRGEAVLEAEASHRARDDISTARMLATVLSRADDHDRAIEILTDAQQAAPNLESLAVDLIVAYEEAGRHLEAISTADQWIGRLEQPDTMHLLKGSNQLALERYRDAKESFEAVLRLNPNHAEGREYLDLVSGMLGQGDNTIIKQEIPPVPLPTWVKEWTPPEITPEHREFGAVVVGAGRATSYLRDREWRVTSHVRIKVLDQRSLSRFSAMHARFDSLYERLYVNLLQVRNEAGEVVATGNLDDFYVVDDNTQGLAVNDKIATLPVPGLEVGRTIELVTTVQSRAPPSRLPYTQYSFFSDLPVLVQEFSIQGDVQEVAYRASGLPEPLREPDRLVWRVSDVPIYRPEPLQDHPTSYMPTLWVTDRGASWEELVREYLEELGPRLSAVDELDAVIAGSNGPASLARYVQENLSYQAIGFGPRAQFPAPVSEILANRYGDCKDHALLLHSLLERSGIPSFLAVVNVGNPVREDVPSLDQFNHMIVYSPTVASGQFFDATDKGYEIGALPPMALGGARALVLDPDRPRFESIAEYGPDSNAVRSEREVRIVDGRNAEVEESLQLHGYTGAVLRMQLADADEIARIRWIQAQLEWHRPVPEIHGVRVNGLENPTKPLVLEMRYTIKDAFRGVSDQLSGSLPAVWEHAYVDVPAVSRRTSPFRSEYPLRFQSRVTLAVPEGFVLEEGRSPRERDERRKWARWSVRPTLRPEGLVVDYNHLQPTARGSAAEYAGFRAAQNEGVSALTAEVVLRRQGR